MQAKRMNCGATQLPVTMPAMSFVRLSLLLTLGASLGCAASRGRPVEPRQRDTISILSPRCAGIRSCVIGHVTSGLAAPVAEAAVFLERELEQDEHEPVRILTLTDEQGVFIVNNPPPGRYRIAVYKNDSSIEVSGMELGQEGTTMLPVHLGLGGS